MVVSARGDVLPQPLPGFTGLSGFRTPHERNANDTSPAPVPRSAAPEPQGTETLAGLDGHAETSRQASQRIMQLTAEYDALDNRHERLVSEYAKLTEPRPTPAGQAVLPSHPSTRSVLSLQSSIYSDQNLTLDESCAPSDALTQHNSLQELTIRYKATISELREELAEKEAHIAHIKGESAGFSRREHALNVQVVQLREKCNKLEVELTLAHNQAGGENKTLLHEKNVAVQELEQKSNELFEAREAVEDMKEQLQRAERTRQHLTDAEVEVARTSIEADTKKNFQIIIDKLRDEERQTTQSLQEEISHLQGELKRETEKSRLRAIFDHQNTDPLPQKDNHVSQSVHRKLSTDMDMMQQEISSLKARLASATSENEVLMRKLVDERSKCLHIPMPPQRSFLTASQSCSTQTASAEVVSSDVPSSDIPDMNGFSNSFQSSIAGLVGELNADSHSAPCPVTNVLFEGLIEAIAEGIPSSKLISTVKSTAAISDLKMLISQYSHRAMRYQTGMSRTKATVLWLRELLQGKINHEIHRLSREKKSQSEQQRAFEMQCCIGTTAPAQRAASLSVSPAGSATTTSSLPLISAATSAFDKGLASPRGFSEASNAQGALEASHSTSPQPQMNEETLQRKIRELEEYHNHLHTARTHGTLNQKCSTSPDNSCNSSSVSSFGKEFFAKGQAGPLSTSLRDHLAQFELDAAKGEGRSGGSRSRSGSSTALHNAKTLPVPMDDRIMCLNAFSSVTPDGYAKSYPAWNTSGRAGSPMDAAPLRVVCISPPSSFLLPPVPWVVLQGQAT